MTGKTGHKVVVDINLTSLDVKDEEDDDDMTSENEEDFPEEMDTFSNRERKRCSKRSKVEPADRPVRERKKKQQFHWSNLGWSYREKQKLLEALKKHPPSAIDQIQSMVSSKTKTQVKDYLNKINKSINWKSDDHMPIVDWTNMARDLVRTEKRDYTDSLSRAMSIISNFEDHPKPADRVPDYKAIYQYLAHVLDGKELPFLGPLESAVMLDLLHGVIHKIEKSETTRQRQVMKWKYQLLSGKVDTTNHHLFIKKARKALSNDFSDFEDKNKILKQEPGIRSSETTQKNTHSIHQQSTAPPSTNTTPTANSAVSSTAVDSRKSLTINETTVISNNMDKADSIAATVYKGSLKAQHKSSNFELSSIRPETDIIISKNKTGGNSMGSDRTKLTAKRGITESQSQRRLGGDNDKSIVPEEEGFTECPPVKRRRCSNMEIETQPHPDSEVVDPGTFGENLDSEQRKMSSSSGGQNKTASTSENNQSLSTNQNGSEHQTKKSTSEKKRRSVGRPPKGIYKVQEDGMELIKACERMYGRRSGRPAGSKKVIPERPEKVPEDPSEIPKKPSLYTLNPFCVPVSLLPLRSKPASKHVTAAPNQILLPAIVSKKHGPLFNKQRSEGITSVSIHRMGAIIPVAKQHVLLPNSASQKS